MTEAQFEFRRRMENAPAWPGPSRLQPAQGLLHGGALVRIVARYPPLGALLVGEPGDARPRAECASYEDGSAFVLVSGGMLDFIDAALGALVAGARLTLGGAATVPAAATPEAVDAALDAVYDSWGARWRQERIELALPPLAPQVADLLTQLSLATRLFLLLHEVGHAVLHGGIPPAERSHAQELEADRFALDVAVDGFGEPRNRMRTAVAGAFLLPRVLEALRLLGHKFPETHPSPAERLDALRTRFRERCDSEFTYFFHTTVAISQTLRLEAAERRLLGLEPPLPVVTADSFVSSMMGMLIELGREKASLSIDEALRDLLLLCRDAEPAELARAAVLARAVFQAGPDARKVVAQPMAGIFAAYDRLVTALRAPLQTLFTEEPR